MLALIAACLPFSSLALKADQFEVPIDIVERGLEAIGIRINSTDVRNIRISGNQFRTRSIMATLSLDTMDAVAVPYGSHTSTYSYIEGGLKHRIDQVSGLGSIWMVARPDLRPIDYSVVVADGDPGYAAVTKGRFSIIDPDGPPEGFLDGYVAAYMISNGYKWDPLLLKTVAGHESTLRFEPIEGDIQLPAVFDQTLNMSILFNPETYLPFAIRTYEEHPFFGPSTNDLRVLDYTSINGLMIPRRFKMVYNNEHLTTDFRADEVSVNIDVEPTFFEIPTERSASTIPIVDPAWTSEVGEKYHNNLWVGMFGGTIKDFEASQPFPDLPGVWVLKMPYGIFRQMLLETATNVILLDAPTDHIELVREWIRVNIGKPLSQVWLTHHHHDHAFGVKTYVKEDGVEVVVPDMAQSYYAKIPGIKFATFERGAPYVAQTDGFRAVFIHIEGSIHSTDHAYAVVMPPCPTENSTVVIFDADHVVLPDLIKTHCDHNEVYQLVTSMTKHRIAKSSIIVPAHGDIRSMNEVFDGIGHIFPNFTPLDFEYRDPSCA